MHTDIDLKVLYFGTPVVLLSTLNADGSPNLAPMSSAWWLGSSCLLGMGGASRTAANLLREREVVVNLVPSTLVDAVDRLALLTGEPDVPPHKRARGYTFEADKFAAAGLTAQESALVAPPRVLECPIQLEGRVGPAHPIGEDAHAWAFEVEVVRVHVEERLLLPGTAYVDPERWDPLLMKFCEYYGGATNVRDSSLARGWQMPHARPVDDAGADADEAVA
ncbi:flavin reductase family protein [Nocardioides sp. MAHUQ-72]|uniref:flavin reductase family protein n=1 Tax=unclassified Nocardioides TaxID=2615069 RepID=UPI003621ACC5